MNETKRKIFEKTMELFAKKGYEATSIEEITAVVGVAKGTFYYYFQTKEELFNFLVKEGIQMLCSSVLAKTSKDVSLQENIRAIILVQIKIVMRYENFVRMIASEMWGDAPRNLLCREELFRYVGIIEKLIVSANESEEKKVANPKMLANEIFGLLCSNLMYKLRNNQKDYDILVSEMENTELNYI